MVTIFDEATVAEALRLAAELRAAGLRVELYPEPDKLGKQIQVRRRARRFRSSRSWAATSVARGEVTIKNLTTRRADESLRAGRRRRRIRRAPSGSRTPETADPTRHRIARANPRHD